MLSLTIIPLQILRPRAHSRSVLHHARAVHGLPRCGDPLAVAHHCVSKCIHSHSVHHVDHWRSGTAQQLVLRNDHTNHHVKWDNWILLLISVRMIQNCSIAVCGMVMKQYIKGNVTSSAAASIKYLTKLSFDEWSSSLFSQYFRVSLTDSRPDYRFFYSIRWL